MREYIIVDVVKEWTRFPWESREFIYDPVRETTVFIDDIIQIQLTNKKILLIQTLLVTYHVQFEPHLYLHDFMRLIKGDNK